MKNLKGLMTAVVIMLAFAGAYAGKASKTNFAGPYKYSLPPQLWTAPIDQTLSRYTLVSGAFGCDPSNKICTYNINNGVVTRNQQGDFHQP